MELSKVITPALWPPISAPSAVPPPINFGRTWHPGLNFSFFHLFKTQGYHRLFCLWRSSNYQDYKSLSPGWSTSIFAQLHAGPGAHSIIWGNSLLLIPHQSTTELSECGRSPSPWMEKLVSNQDISAVLSSFTNGVTGLFPSASLSGRSYWYNLFPLWDDLDVPKVRRCPPVIFGREFFLVGEHTDLAHDLLP